MFILSGHFVNRQETFHEIMTRLISAMELDSPKNIVNVDRDNILDGGFRAFQRTSFNPHRLLNVRFTGEDGIDTGGLSNDFMRLSVHAVQSLSIFAGAENSKWIALDYNGKV